MGAPDQATKAEAFRALHHGDEALVLPNVSDAGTAVLTASMGFPALATASAGVAWAQGYPDGEQMERGEMLEAVRRIASRVALPVSADMEGGYGATPEEVAETVRLTLEAGAIGVNLEDGLDHAAGTMRDMGLANDCIKAARSAGQDAGIPVVINARTDVYFDKGASEENKLSDAITRANAYLEAGADCAFVIAVTEGAAIGDLVREIDGPVNIVGGAGGLDIKALADLGVRRISMAGGMTRTTFGVLKNALSEILETGGISFLQGGMAHPQLNQLFERDDL
ncbi:MAG: isocitrate lyase/phosphoenolpyruvate mutase family protein [Rhodospirillales bacterium]|jgi:2-methylisocitrate lyase-like PEP mutase family enzyme|nr:isocitrate lyase/phosphoenolpyruvate mutase family protein [Rhodospirillales bacterium]